MKLFGAAAALVLAVLPVCTLFASKAYAQMPHVNMLPDEPTKTPEEKEAEAARDKAYKESLKKIPDPKTSSDPWGTVRSDAPKAPAPKTATTKKTKTGSNAN